MARPKGTKYIETPEKMWELFLKYKKNVNENPILVHDFVGKDGDSVNRKKQRPLTMEGFDCFVMDLEGIRSRGVEQYFTNQDNGYTDYLSICSRIKREIRNNQVEGGMAGIYNPSITQRLNSLVEKTENKHEVSEILIKRES